MTNVSFFTTLNNIFRLQSFSVALRCDRTGWHFIRDIHTGHLHTQLIHFSGLVLKNCCDRLSFSPFRLFVDDHFTVTSCIKVQGRRRLFLPLPHLPTSLAFERCSAITWLLIPEDKNRSMVWSDWSGVGYTGRVQSCPSAAPPGDNPPQAIWKQSITNVDTGITSRCCSNKPSYQQFLSSKKWCETDINGTSRLKAEFTRGNWHWRLYVAKNRCSEAAVQRIATTCPYRPHVYHPTQTTQQSTKTSCYKR